MPKYYSLVMKYLSVKDSTATSYIYSLGCHDVIVLILYVQYLYGINTLLGISLMQYIKFKIPD